MDMLTPTSGTRSCHRNLKFGYFSQHHVDQLDMSVRFFFLREFTIICFYVKPKFFLSFFLHINNCCVQIGVGKCFYPTKYYVNIGGKKPNFFQLLPQQKIFLYPGIKKINDSGVFFSNAAQVSIAYLK